MATAASHYFVQHPLNPIRAARSSVRRATPIHLPTALKLSRSEGKFIVTAATPGIKMENLSLELIGKRTLRLRVMNDEHGDRPWEHIICTHGNPGTTPLQRSQPAMFAGIVSPAVAYFEAAPECTLEDASAAAAASASTSEAMPDAPPPMANAANEAAVPGSEELPVEEPLTKVAPGTSTHATDVKQPEQDTVREQMVVVLDKSLCLPQHVDGAGIVCTYEEGLVRIEIPIADPKPDSEHELLMAKLRGDKEEAVAELARLEQAIKEQRDKVRDIHHAALRAAKAAAGPALSCHIQRLAFTPHPHQ
jgi:HSP20 family molecular chaperone IbpA